MTKWEEDTVIELKEYVDQAFPFALRGDDAITFSVLARIVQGPCQCICTDGERAMVCLSKRPYPVWVWCRDEEDEDAVRAIADCLRRRFPPEEGYRYNLAYGLPERLRAMGAPFAEMKIEVNLLSYRLDEILPATHPCDGHMDVARMDQLDELARHLQAAVFEMERMERSLEDCRQVVAEKIEAGQQFIWLDGQGALAAITSWRAIGEYGGVTGVYTLPSHRRRGYAMNLVHGVTQRVLQDGLTPILYTDADYGASNSCYQKIGYRQVGSLCTASMR